MSLRLKKDRIILDLNELIEEVSCIDERDKLEIIVRDLEELRLTEDI